MNAKTSKGFTALHIAAYNDYENLCIILIENGAKSNAVDYDGNNGTFFNILIYYGISSHWFHIIFIGVLLLFSALHIAVSHGSVSSVNVLLGDPNLDPRAANHRCIHHYFVVLFSAICLVFCLVYFLIVPIFIFSAYKHHWLWLQPIFLSQIRSIFFIYLWISIQIILLIHAIKMAIRVTSIILFFINF